MITGLREVFNRQVASQRYQRAGGRTVPDQNTALRTAVQWLCSAQDATGCGGFARAYSLIHGWELPYPETTGYIIPTFLALADRFSDLHLRERAKKAGAWLSQMQFESGALCSKQYRPGNKAPSVFNTGMGLHGWVSLCELENDETSLISARRAADWLVEQQERDGSWVRHSFNGIPHTYYTMVDWALLRFGYLTQDRRYQETAVRNLNWTLGKQKSNGWFDDCAFSNGEAVTTHTLSYITQGLVESGRLLQEDRYIEAAHRGARPLLNYFKKAERLPGCFDCEWRPTANWECLSGNAQTSIVWRSLATLLSDTSWKEAADLISHKIRSSQRMGCRIPGINGGISGSWPIDGAYDSYAFPCHAAKFYVDALLLSG